MEVKQTSNRIHPLMAGAAASVMLVSLVGVAAITGLLPSSHGTAAPAAETVVASAQPVDANLAATAQPAALTPVAPAAPVAPVAPVASAAPAVVEHRHVVVHKHVTQRAAPAASQPAASPQYVQTSTAPNQTYQQPQPAQPVQPVQPVQQTAQASAPTSGVGIAAGAVIGGLLGNQVGGGKGKALATIAGAVGGGYVGNEVEKRVRY